MHDKGVEAGPSLRFVNSRHSGIVVSTRRQPINRLGRQGDETAIAQNRSCAALALFIRVKRFRSVFAAHARALYLLHRKAKRITP